MKFSSMHRGLVLTVLAGSVFAGATYKLSDSIVGEGFYDAFSFEAIPDPTHGRVNYVDEATARSEKLAYATGKSFVLRADDTTVLSSSGPGRNSVRIRSNAQYTTHVAVFDIPHMPQGCGTWPAVWETSESNWPHGGEVDIVEGVNNESPNLSSLHTGAGCSIPSSGIDQLGTTVSTNCDANANGNTGCGVRFTQNYASFGPGFNYNGGGWYALERTNDYISIWFWQRWDLSVPIDVRAGAPVIDTSNWGTPAAHFPNTHCNLASHFDANNIIINLTFCGDWAGSESVYRSSGCPSTCVGYVDNNPSAFSDAYFEFNSIHVYE